MLSQPKPIEEQGIQVLNWQANLTIRLSPSKAGTYLSSCVHNGPLYLQKPFYPEGPGHPHLYLLHPPAGIVSGDILSMRIYVESDASGLATTPGATVVYRARKDNPVQRQVINLELEEKAILEWFPLETIVHNDAYFDATTTITMSHNSHFSGWEITSFGLPASNKLFVKGRFRQRYRIIVDGVTQFVDNINIDDSNRDALLYSKAGMQNYMVSGFCVFGPVLMPPPSEGRQEDTQLELLRQQQPVINTDKNTNCQISITRLGNFYVGRYLGSSAEQARKQFTQWWSLIRQEMLGLDACIPRVWAN